ncbi:MAG: CDP-diacylglycerol--serine O-phosphatidyltransferase [Bacteroidota bacterium]
MTRFIPNVLTICNAISGLLAIMLGYPVMGAYFIIAAMVLDLLDGLAARLLDGSTPLGKELDSMADLISFGIAPAYLFYQLSLDIDALLVSLLYVLSALFRLAKFNVGSQSSTFTGLPSPAAAGVATGAILLHASSAAACPSWLPHATMILSAIGMNVDFGFFSLKGGSPHRDWRLWLVVVSTVVSMTFHWHYGLFICYISYVMVSLISKAVVRS